MKSFPQFQRRNCSTPRRLRRGVLTLEMVLVLPIVLLVVLGIVQLSLLLLANQAVAAAASVGARTASLPGATSGAVETAVNQALASWRFAPHVEPVAVEPDPHAAPTGTPIQVTVSVRSVDAVPNLLKFVGITLDNHRLQSTFVARKE